MHEERYVSLLPRPVLARPESGAFSLGPQTELIVSHGGDTRLAAALEADVRRAFGNLAPRSVAAGELHTGQGPTAEGVLRLAVDEEVGGPESYRLRVTPEEITVSGADRTGLWHGLTTLRQLMPDEVWRRWVPGEALPVPCGEVIDEPGLAWRGGMIDVARHFLPKADLLRYIDLFAMHKLNVLQLHLCDDQAWRIESKRYPRLHEVGSHRPNTCLDPATDPGRHDGTPHGGYYTLADLAEISGYAAERGVTVIPEIDLPGHSSALLAAYPEFGPREHAMRHAVRNCGGVFDATVAPLPATVEFVLGVLDEVLAAVVPDTPYVHLGGDECILAAWAEDPRVVEYAKSVGVAPDEAMHGHFLRQLAAGLAQRDRRMAVWDEAFVTGGLAPGSVVTAWRGDKVARRIATAGYDVVRCPVFPTYLDYSQSADSTEPLSIGGPITLEDVASFEPTPADWAPEERERVIGMQFQCWSERIEDARQLDYAVFPRASVLADVAWRGQAQAPWPEEQDRLVAHLARLEAAGVEYRPLGGPHAWQQGGTGSRAWVQRPPIGQIRDQLEQLSGAGSNDGIEW